jgi:uncharacterized protein YeaO (DUF488 family)
MIKTKSIYKPKEEDDGTRILVTRFYPRGVRKDHFDQWMRQLAPSAQLLKSYKLGEKNWEQFTIALLSELRDNTDSLETIHRLHSQSNFNNITLLCYEKDGNPCHRHILKEILEKPKMINSYFVSENTDNHKRCSMQSHISYEKTCMVP